jgi:hypothetical protein
MGLPWIRLDTDMPDHPKILGLLTEKNGRAIAFVWLCAMAYAGKHETDGFVPREAVSRINGTTTDMATLVRHGLLTECAGGWDIHGWNEYQVSSDESRERRERAKHAAAVRWSKAANRRPRSVS